jgi:hypothetical protein
MGEAGRKRVRQYRADAVGLAFLERVIAALGGRSCEVTGWRCG